MDGLCDKQNNNNLPMKGVLGTRLYSGQRLLREGVDKLIGALLSTLSMSVFERLRVSVDFDWRWLGKDKEQLETVFKTRDVKKQE